MISTIAAIVLEIPESLLDIFFSLVTFYIRSPFKFMCLLQHSNNLL
jgi:hypothetical protein